MRPLHGEETVTSSLFNPGARVVLHYFRVSLVRVLIVYSFSVAFKAIPSSIALHGSSLYYWYCFVAIRLSFPF